MKGKLASLALVALPVAALGQLQYRADALIFDGNVGATPSGIAGGYIVGNLQTDAGLVSALWSAGGSQALAAPSGATLFGAAGVNRFGTAVGTAGSARGAVAGIVWRNGAAEWLPNEDEDDDTTETLYGSRALGINDGGTIIGGAETEYGSVGVVWDGDDVRLLMGLDPVGEYQESRANAINDAGQIAGSAKGAGRRQAVVWETSGVRVLGGLGEDSAASDVNDLGVSVGYTTTPDGFTSAFVNDGSTTTLLPTLTGLAYGSANAINNAGLIVGSSAPEGTAEATATLWQNGQAIDLNSLLGPSATDWQLVAATDIDDDGTIVGFGFHRGEYGSFRLTPVPEPASMVALGLGVAAFVRRRSRRA